MRLHSSVKDKVLDWFTKHPDKVFTTAVLVEKFAFTGKEPVIRYHLKRLLEEGRVVNRGGTKNWKLQFNTNWETSDRNPAVVRQKAMELGSQRVVQVPGIEFDPARPQITAIDHPLVVTWFANQLGRSILTRMSARKDVFSEEDIKFVTKLLNHKYPLSEQQEMDLVRERKV